MNECLNLFIDPEASHPGRRKLRSEANGSPGSRKSRTGSNPYPLQPALLQQPPKKRREAHGVESDTFRVDKLESDSDIKSGNHRIGEDDHLLVFKKAADLLRLSLDLEAGGGGMATFISKISVIE